MIFQALPSTTDTGAILQLRDIRDTNASRALVLYGSEDVQECDGARTLQLVERAVDSMRALRARADAISAQSLDLIRLTQRERLQMQAELRQAREEAARFQQQAQEAMAAFTEASLRRREAELATQHAQARADAAETKSRSLEMYLKKIGQHLRERLT